MMLNQLINLPGYLNETYGTTFNLAENWNKKSGQWVKSGGIGLYACILLLALLFLKIINDEKIDTLARAVALIDEGVSVMMNKTGCTAACNNAGLAAGNLGSKFTYETGWFNLTLKFVKSSSDTWDGLTVSWYDSNADGTNALYVSLFIYALNHHFNCYCVEMDINILLTKMGSLCILLNLVPPSKCLSIHQSSSKNSNKSC